MYSPWARRPIDVREVCRMNQTASSVGLMYRVFPPMPAIPSVAV